MPVNPTQKCSRCPCPCLGVACACYILCGVRVNLPFYSLNSQPPNLTSWSSSLFQANSILSSKNIQSAVVLPWCIGDLRSICGIPNIFFLSSSPSLSLSLSLSLPLILSLPSPPYFTSKGSKNTNLQSSKQSVPEHCGPGAPNPQFCLTSPHET